MSFLYCPWRNVSDNKHDTLALVYRKSSIKPSGDLLILNILELRAYLRRGLFNLAKKMVPVLHKELEYKVEKLKYKKLEVMQPRIKSKSKLPAGE